MPKQHDTSAKHEPTSLGLALLRSLRLGIPRVGLVEPSISPSPRTDVEAAPETVLRSHTTWPRDAQRIRVYRAETPLKGLIFTTLKECEDFCESVVGTFWWSNRFPELGLAKIPRLRDGRGARRAFYREDPGHPTITLPRQYRNARVILHELAHWTMHANHDLPAHGHTFTRVFMDLTAEFSGPQARERLARAYAEHKVHIGAEAVLGPDGIYRYGNDERIRLGRDRVLVIDHLGSRTPMSGVLIRLTKKHITLNTDIIGDIQIPRDSIWRVRGAQ